MLIGNKKDNFSEIKEFVEALCEAGTSLKKINEARFPVSEMEFDKIIHEWSGAHTNQLLNFIHSRHYKSIFKNQHQNLFSSIQPPSALPDYPTPEFIDMTDEELKAGIVVSYFFCNSPFGKMMIAQTEKGICYAGFISNDKDACKKIKSIYGGVSIRKADIDTKIENTLCYPCNKLNINKLIFHVKGTEFQLSIWKKLAKIPFGMLESYSNIARELGADEKSSRAVGTAVGNNPVTILIPCHRVVQSDGNISGYYWGPAMKKIILFWEFVKSGSRHTY